jgi:hypothetical protein
MEPRKVFLWGGFDFCAIFFFSRWTFGGDFSLLSIVLEVPPPQKWEEKEKEQ